VSHVGTTGGRTSARERFDSIFVRHHSAVDAYVRRRMEPELCEDVVADTFLVAWRRLDDVPDDARAWLIGVARNIMATERRAKARRRSLLMRLVATQPSANGRDRVDNDVGIVRDALARLSEKDREAITLIAWDELTPQEASAVLGEESGSFRVRLHRARRRLRRHLESAGITVDRAACHEAKPRVAEGGRRT
jgi:RNA polymerase sigma-70 factor, ECF subfamily